MRRWFFALVVMIPKTLFKNVVCQILVLSDNFFRNTGTIFVTHAPPDPGHKGEGGYP